jgi:hypothetical protein
LTIEHRIDAILSQAGVGIRLVGDFDIRGVDIIVGHDEQVGAVSY